MQNPYDFLFCLKIRVLYLLGTMDASLIKTVDLCRYYQKGRYDVKAIDGISLEMRRGEFLEHCKHIRKMPKFIARKTLDFVRQNNRLVRLKSPIYRIVREHMAV